MGPDDACLASLGLTDVKPIVPQDLTKNGPEMQAEGAMRSEVVWPRVRHSPPARFPFADQRLQVAVDRLHPLALLLLSRAWHSSPSKGFPRTMLH